MKKPKTALESIIEQAKSAGLDFDKEEPVIKVIFIEEDVDPGEQIPDLKLDVIYEDDLAREFLSCFSIKDRWDDCTYYKFIAYTKNHLINSYEYDGSTILFITPLKPETNWSKYVN